MSHQGDVGMKDFFFASPTMLAARHASMSPRGIGFLLLSTDEQGRNALLVGGQDDPLNHVADLTSDRFRCHVGFVPLLTLILIASPLLFTPLSTCDLVQVVVRLPTSPGRQSERDGSKSAHRHLCMNSFLAAYL